MLGEDEDVAFALAQRGDFDDVEGEAVQEVGAEFVLGGEGGEVGVGGGDDSDVGGDGFVAADALEGAVFDDAEEFFLDGCGGVADFVEEEGAAVGGFEAGEAAAGGAGEGAGFVAEEFGVEDAFGEGAAVEGEVGAVPAWGEEFEAVGDDFLSGAAFTRDEDRAIEGGEGGDVGEHGLEGGGFADGVLGGGGGSGVIWHELAKIGIF